MSTLTVRSHVSRDLLQSAGMFKNERLVAWEYISNGLQYIDPGTSAIVRVKLESKKGRMTIEDSGRGMDWAGLENFFVMHGENIDRKAGRPGRGRFGTGKSAAFGIGDVLRITTVRNGERSTVELTRDDLKKADDGDPVPVRTLEREVATDHANGTLVEIEGIHLRSLDQAGITGYVERHLAHWPKDSTVIVNNHQCEFAEPPTERIEIFEPSPDEEPKLGQVKLVIKVSKSPLPDELRGIAIYASGTWHETTLLTSAGKEMSEFIFGEIDVPALDTDTSTPPALDASRSMRLNPDNDLVKAIYGFMGPKIEEVRRQLVEQQREQRASEEAKRLRKEASQIEEIINSDFDEFRRRLNKVKAAAAKTGFDAGDGSAGGGDGAGDDDFLSGGEDPAEIVAEEGEVGKRGESEGADDGPPRRLNPIVKPDDQGKAKGHHDKTNGKPRRRGGFTIEFDNQGAESARATYQGEKRTIFVNLDHPQIATALKGRDPEDAVFKRLAYEVAFSEYAVALAQELDNHGEYADISDPIVDIRETLNRVALAAASLYS